MPTMLHEGWEQAQLQDTETKMVLVDCWKVRSTNLQLIYQLDSYIIGFHLLLLEIGWSVFQLGTRANAWQLVFGYLLLIYKQL